jgi:hypothetical protein
MFARILADFFAKSDDCRSFWKDFGGGVVPGGGEFRKKEGELTPADSLKAVCWVLLNPL